MRAAVAVAAWAISLTVAVTLLVNPAAGHPANDFYPTGRRWAPNDTEKYVIDNNVPSGGFRDQIRAGLDVWSDGAAGNGPKFVDDGLITASNNFDPCDHDRSIAFAYENLGLAVGTGSETQLGLTLGCYNASVGGTFEITFQITMEKTAEWGGASGWYIGTGSPGGNQWDLRSITTHEAGHATGWYGHFTANTYCPTPPQSAVTETMCAGSTAIKSTTMLRTRETHDLHTFNAAY